MGERTVPIKYLNDESKGKAGKMKNLYNLILDSPKGAEKEKDDPEKMDHDNKVSKNLVEHYFRRPLKNNIPIYHRIVSFQRKV
jgi:hypothetical protein